MKIFIIQEKRQFIHGYFKQLSYVSKVESRKTIYHRGGKGSGTQCWQSKIIINEPEQPDEQPEQFGILQLKMADRIKLVHCSGCI